MKNRLLLFAFFILQFSYSSLAQYDPSKVNKKAVALYDQALEKAQNDQYTEAISLLEQAIQKDANYIEAYLSLAGVYGQLKDRTKSVAYYEKAFSIDAAYTSEFKLPYAINLAGLGQFEKALSVINELLARPNLPPNTKKAAEYRKKAFEFAIDYAKNHPANNYVFAPKNIGDGVNTSSSEFFPSLPIESNQIIFTRRIGHARDNFFTSKKQGTGWGPSQPLFGEIDRSENQGALMISQDGTQLVFAAEGAQRSYGRWDIYMSFLTPEGWSEPVNLGGKINTEFWESQPCLSPDKRDLYFVSNRPGGFGGSDIYVSHLVNGRWSEPENLGPEVNTAGDEDSPFMHADNQTFFFGSNGLTGYGDKDLFVRRKKADGTWGKPENMGYPINTIDNEGTLFVAADGKTAYYASDRSDSKGGMDIYTFEIPEWDRPYKTLWVKGKVYDDKTKKGLPSAVELIDLSTKQTISKVQTDEVGNYLITLPVGKDYAFNVARQGYLFYSDNYSLKDKAPDSVYQKDIPLQPIEVNASVVLRNIFFDVNKYELKSESQIELDRLVDLLQQNPTVKIQIEGHTDNVGAPADNQKLSENRAKAVVNYLVTKGIVPTRLSAKGYGETKPVADNKTDEGRAQNRRTEVKIVAR
jgi:outer membrane protein OmpA-like peptidoglycan-associated protein